MSVSHNFSSQEYAPQAEDSNNDKSNPVNQVRYPGSTHPMLTPGSAPILPSGELHGIQPGYPSTLQSYPVPVIQQPVPSACVSMSQELSECPPGLEYLSAVDELLVHQEVELFEALAGFETNNEYTIKNKHGQKTYYAVEGNDAYTRNFFGRLRPFHLKILDNNQMEVIHMHRPLACTAICCPCWLQSIKVTAPPGTVIGSIEQQWSILKPQYVVKNANNDVVLQIKGPLCSCSKCCNVDFNIYSKDGERKVGKISKQWSGLVRELFTDADNFGISFPLDIDVQTKAVLLGALFLIDFMYFETSK